MHRSVLGAVWREIFVALPVSPGDRLTRPAHWRRHTALNRVKVDGGATWKSPLARVCTCWTGALAPDWRCALRAVRRVGIGAHTTVRQLLQHAAGNGYVPVVPAASASAECCVLHARPG